MKKKTLKLAKYVLITILILFILLLAGVALRLLYSPKLQPWHTFAPKELSIAEIDKATVQEYIEHENKIFDDIYREVVQKTPENQKHSLNRYFEKSLIYPPSFKENWNKSYTMVPKNPKGAVVLLHGLTDSPYSLRHIAKLYYQKDFVVIGLRAPGHGSVPAALAKSIWQEWMAATRLAVREAKKLSPEGPLHMVGFSKGGALAIKYALDALEDKSLKRPDKLILISPMIGIMRLSKLVELIAIPAIIPGFERAAWLSIIPEFNPFKFNSFPVNGLKQARLLITDMNQQIARLHKNGKIQELPPITSFQSIVDYTVSTPAIINDLYSYLPDNGSELVLFDINRYTAFMPLVRPVFINMMPNMLPDLPQNYKISIIGNSAPGMPNTVESSVPSGGTNFTTRDLGLKYPQEVFSLSHVSLPFPENDSLYGSSPDPETKNEFGLSLGLVSNAQGERGVLAINTNLFFRISSNPLFPYLEKRIDNIIDEAPALAKAADKKEKIGTKTKIKEEEYENIMKEADYDEEPF